MVAELAESPLLGRTSRPTSLTPSPSNVVSITSKAMRWPLIPLKEMSPFAQSEKVTVLPSVLSVQPRVLLQLPSVVLCSFPLVPSKRRHRRASSSDGSMSTMLPSVSR